MIYNDPVYGKVDIKEPVILEIIRSKPLQRLKKISQHGPSVYNKYYTKRVISRFEHSLGVFILLKKLGASLEEQIAGLLHDVGHTVFSHTIDFLYPEENGEYDKKHHKELINNSKIPEILKKYNVRLKKVLDESKFTILEKSLPGLCADRIDYFLRDPFLPKSFNKNLVLDNLLVFKGQIIFKNKKAALYFSKQYLKMNELFWARPLDELLYFLMVDIFKKALAEKLIKYTDLFLTEDEFLDKLKKIKNQYINNKLDLIKNIKLRQVVVSKNKISQSYYVKSKIRVVDPLVLNGDKIERLSSLNLEYKNKAKDFYNKHSRKRWIGYKLSNKGKVHPVK